MLQFTRSRLLDLLVDLNSSTHVPKSRRFNLGSPSHPTPPRFLSPTLLAAHHPSSALNLLTLEPPPLNGAGLTTKLEALDADTSSTSSDSADESSRNRNRNRKHYDSEDDMDDDDDREAYLEEIRETNYKRGIPGTPPRFIREKLKADADRERKEAQEQARLAAEAQAAAEASGVKQEPTDEPMHDALQMPPRTPQRNRVSLEDLYPAPGHTPPYLRDPSPFLMSLEEEEAFYYNIDENLHGDIPVAPEPTHTSPSSKTESDPRNPMSVYCWLRKYQPQVFLQEGEGEKKPRGRGGRKKAAADGDSGDEALAPTTTGKTTGKRRRADTKGEGDAEEHVTPSRGRGGGRGRGGRRKQENHPGEPPVKKQRRLVARNS